ncbi:hypothetical protein C0992_005402 [Termitomyces sp. T32_za158]|nr:hypothetical protein C0992_005402 [Termitomyces sp. T32_za158]
MSTSHLHELLIHFWYYLQIKKNFLEVCAVHNASGFGWDDETKKPVATDAVWMAYLKAHKSHERWRDTPFLLYHEVEYLVHGVVATEAAAFHPGNSPATTEEISWSDSNYGSPISPPAPLPSISAAGSFQSVSTDSSILQDELTQEIEALADDQALPIPSKKRTHADSDTFSPSPQKLSSVKRSCRGYHNAFNAMSEVADAILGLSKTMEVGPSTPQHRKQSMDIVTKDGKFSKSEMAHVMVLFAKDIAYANTFVSTDDKEVRTEFLRALL